jgi:hypothetical protein
MAPTLDRFQLLDLDDSPAPEAQIAPPAPAPTPQAAPVAVAAPVAAVALEPEILPAEGWIQTATAGDGQWGDSTFHNLSNGARASGMVSDLRSLKSGADLAWSPVTGRIYDAKGNEIAGKRVVARSDSGAHLGIVSDRYMPIDHDVLFDLAEAIQGVDRNAGELCYSNAGHKDGGALPFLQLKGSTRTIGRDARGCSVEVRDLLTLATSHNGTISLRGGMGQVVIVCDNTYAHAVGGCGSIGIRHTKNAAERIEAAKIIARKMHERGELWDAAASRLLMQSMTSEDFAALTRVLVPNETTRSENIRLEIANAYESSPGAAPGSAWGAMQAVTWWTSHGRESYADDLLVGRGRGQEIQDQAWWTLTTDEGAASLEKVRRGLS